MRLAVVAASLALGVSSLSWADAPKFSGYLETSYNYNFNQPNGQINRGRSFDTRANSFNLNAFQLQATGALGDNSGYTAKMLFGTDASAIKNPNGNATNLTGTTNDEVDIEEAYAWYKAPLGSGLTITAGRFVTFEGIEVIEGKDDYTVSRGLLFGLAEPFTHTGVKADYQFTKQLDLALGVVNGWDQVEDQNSSKTFIGRLGVNLGDPFSGGLSWTYGDEKPYAGSAVDVNHDMRTSVDATFSTVFNKTFTLAYQANYGEEANANTYAESHNGTVAPAGTSYATWFGFGIQPKVTITDKFWIGGRYEYFEDKDGARTGGVAGTLKPTTLQNFTIAPAYKLTDALTVQTELRYDWSNVNYFDQRNSAGAVPAGFASANQATVGAKIDYVF